MFLANVGSLNYRKIVSRLWRKMSSVSTRFYRCFCTFLLKKRCFYVCELVHVYFWYVSLLHLDIIHISKERLLNALVITHNFAARDVSNWSEFFVFIVKSVPSNRANNFHDFWGQVFRNVFNYVVNNTAHYKFLQFFHFCGIVTCGALDRHFFVC